LNEYLTIASGKLLAISKNYDLLRQNKSTKSLLFAVHNLGLSATNPISPK